MAAASLSSVDVLYDIEKELSLPFRGVPLGPTLSQACYIHLYTAHGRWGIAARLRQRARMFKYWQRPFSGRAAMPRLRERSIVMTCMSDHVRLTGLMYPVLQELGPERCTVLCAASHMLANVPRRAQSLDWEQAMHFDVPAWRAEYLKCRTMWHRRLRELCRKYRAPRGVYEWLVFQMLIASQYVAGSLEFLRAVRPSMIVTDYDRSSMWSCLVLSARLLEIPTFTQVHGVVNERAIGYVPFLADKVFCWGEMQRQQFIAEGETPEKLLVTGCPRLSRDLATTQAEARAKLGLAPRRPVLMLGTTTLSDDQRRTIAELFCTAAETLTDVSAVVRLHPVEQLDTYAPVAKRHSSVRFFKNSDATLDEALAAADIVVVPNTGFGSDALLKRRLAVVLNPPNFALGHGSDLIKRARCPAATNAKELVSIIRRLLTSEPERKRRFAAAERYVKDFCAFFGRDAARRIADIVRKSLP
jgi:hypothetical protein